MSLEYNIFVLSWVHASYFYFYFFYCRVEFRIRTFLWGINESSNYSLVKISEEKVKKKNLTSSCSYFKGPDLCMENLVALNFNNFENVFMAQKDFFLSHLE